MKNPEFKVLWTLVGNKNYINEFEKQTIRYYRVVYDKALINVIKFRDVQPRLPIINEMKHIIRRDLKIVIDNRGFRIYYHCEGQSLNKHFKYTGDDTKARQKLKKFINDNGFERKLIDNGELIISEKK
jgi:hypothetical protein